MEHLVLVTGGNRGLGFELCKKLVMSGKRVLLTSRDSHAGKDACAKIEAMAEKSGFCTPLQLDQAAPKSISDLVSIVQSKHDQKITALINNAGVLPRVWDEASFDTAKKTNYDGPTQLTIGLLPYLAPGCRIVMMSSGMGSLSDAPQDSWYTQAIRTATSLAEMDNFDFRADDPFSKSFAPTYRITKAMLNRATQLLATDRALTSRNITVNACCPGWCRTDMGGESATRSAEQGASSALLFLDADDPVTGTFQRNGVPIEW